MNNQPVIVERTMHASPKKIWEALTDKNEMKKWYFDLSEFKAVPGFRFTFDGQNKKGEKKVHLCEVKEVIPMKKLSYSWRYEGVEGDSLVAFELFPDGDQTKVRVTHTGLETFPPESGDFAKENFLEGWTFIINNSLKEFVEQ
jgi:uncharacterized protein YndB with AHSA1/START domain